MSVPYKPAGYPNVIPYLMVKDISALMEFCFSVFDAQQVERLDDLEGNPRHVELKIGDSIIMIGPHREGSPAQNSMLYLYVHDVDATYAKAMKAGSTSMLEPSDQFYGDRNAGVTGPQGITWWISTHMQDVSTEEMQKRLHAQLEQS